MNIKISKDLAKAIGFDNLKVFGLTQDEWRWNSRPQTVYLPSHGQKTIKKLMGLLESHEKIRGTKTALRDCATWLKALGGAVIKPRSVAQFESLLRHTLQKSGEANVAAGRPIGPRVYKKDEKRDVWSCYYVTETKYTPEHTHNDSYSPAFATASLVYTEFGGRRGSSMVFHSEDCMRMTVEEAMARKGYIMETAELRVEYDRRRELFYKWSDDIGKQFLATGSATDDVDGNREGRRNTWYWRSTNTVNLDKGGEPSRVVIDLFQEDENDNSNRRHNRDTYIDRLWWHKKRSAQDEDVEVDEDVDDDDWEDSWDDVPEPEIPLHPMLACFDMRRHLRLRIDVGQLTEYQYDSKLGDKLILPTDSRNLVEMLLAHKSQFRDIVKGKSGGAIILCAGIPGTGKTLTAEVYAEVMHRPLYTVQASQLGIDPDELEDELLKTFARAGRWNAILLLDEADVYVHKRGNDLIQNAIVGVFLRVLEYYKGVMFMTTNRSDLVDDAIASRCVARIDYVAPTSKNQKAIWGVLCETAGINIKPEVIDQVVARYPELTGRDVKNLLKLAELISSSRECEITLDVLRFAKRFKPTVSTAGETADDEMVTLPPMPDLSEPQIDVPATAESESESKPESTGNGNWRDTAALVFEDGAPHAVSEVKEAVSKVAPEVHPNAVTNVLRQLIKAGRLSRLSSGLYRRD